MRNNAESGAEKSPDDAGYYDAENPQGMLRNAMPFPPEGTVTYCQYGADYMKPTDLWGVHPPSMTYDRCAPGDTCHLHNPSSRTGWYSGAFRDATVKVKDMPGRDAEKLERRSAFQQRTSGTRSEVRAMVPRELSEAIMEAVEEPGKGAEQSTLAESIQ